MTSVKSMRRFTLHRSGERLHPVRGYPKVAEGVEFSDGTVSLRWVVGEAQCTSVWGSVAAMTTVHLHDNTRLIWWDGVSEARNRGRLDAYQDRCEGCLGGSLSGDGSGPTWPMETAEESEEWVAGYIEEAWLHGWTPITEEDPTP